MSSPPATTTSVMADLARRVAAIGWGAPDSPKPGYVTCSLCGHQILEGRPVFMLHDRAYCSTRHRSEASTDAGGCLLQHHDAPRLTHKASYRTFADMPSASSEWHAYHICD